MGFSQRGQRRKVYQVKGVRIGGASGYGDAALVEEVLEPMFKTRSAEVLVVNVLESKGTPWSEFSARRAEGRRSEAVDKPRIWETRASGRSSSRRLRPEA